MNQSYKNFRSFVEFRGNNQRLFRGGVKRVRDRESASRVCAAATIAVARRKTERQETVSGRGNNVLESCPGPWGALRLPSLWSLETRLCLSFFLSFPACDNPFPPHLALRVISLSANGAWVFRSIERWPSKRAWWTSKPATMSRGLSSGGQKEKGWGRKVGHCCAARFIFNVYYYLW